MKDLGALLPLVGIFAVFWFLMILPMRRRQKATAQMQSELAVGDRVVTSGGMFGTIAHLAEDRVGLEVAPQVVVEIARGALVGKTVLDGMDG
ncbi:preprotein translocase subunit YajC [Nocardioides jiangxiensis]|uniref:Preprotein translocase subunit YajC n=1 Tax=Nocardioides jiangxiensis TaxID=3064524 RepID=A0ABT9AWR9_9ACTN|nr:preprotein translocase subunit YajC [Nocardioides sp. WY-20]MDO7866931.1 preprotein translocase subunit YajC [Nocardioides sp. WY-20]